MPLARQRFLAFVFSAIFTGAAGAIFSHYLIVASPEFFGFSYAVLFLSMILVGGSSTIYGPIVAGILLTIISELLSGLGPVRFMIVAVIIILTMRFFPRGIWGLVKQFSYWSSRAPEIPKEDVRISPGNREAIQSTEGLPTRPP